MLAAVVGWLDGTEVHYDQPRHTLVFTGTQPVQPDALAQVLAAHGFELLWWNGPQGPDPTRTPSTASTATTHPDWTPVDEDAARKNAWIAAHPERYRQLTGRTMPASPHADQ